MGDRESVRNKGFGFATFEDLPDTQLEQLTKAGGWDIDGKMVSNAKLLMMVILA